MIRSEGPRRFRITIPMLERYGYDDNCEGCRFERFGMRANRAHTEQCRKRITECLNNDPEMKQVVDREDERMRYQIEKDEEDEKMMQTIQETGDADIEIEGENATGIQQEEDEPADVDMQGEIRAAIDRIEARQQHELKITELIKTTKRNTGGRRGGIQPTKGNNNSENHGT